MKTHFTLDYIEEIDFFVLAINSHAKGYKLCWNINKELQLNFEKAEDQVINNELMFSRYFCTTNKGDEYNIITNRSKKGYLIPDLKQTLLYFAKEMFGEKTKIRLRPSYFPFTEPSAEVDVSCNICNSKGCNVCKNTGYLEILGCGMVDPAVLDNCGIDSQKYTGYAFGMGIERIAMLKYGVKDLRLFFENDVRFLKQFSSL